MNAPDSARVIQHIHRKEHSIKHFHSALTLKMSSCTTKTNIGTLKGVVLNRYAGSISEFLQKHNCSEKHIKHFENKNFSPVEVYRGVPYAKPPINELILKNPEIKEGSLNEIDCTKLSPVSLQDEMIAKMASDPSKRTDSCFSTHLDLLDQQRYQMSRNCLTMDIYKPVTKKHNLPVFFWIHGGGFVSGSKQEYNGEILAALHEIIVVIPQYRLHFLGFFQELRS